MSGPFGPATGVVFPSLPDMAPSSAPVPVGPGYEVTPAALADAARGVEDVLGELRALGVGMGRAEAGRGVAVLVAGTGPPGHAGLAAAFVSFCSRWEWGVRALVQAGREMAGGLDAAAAAYAGVDRDQGEALRRILPGAEPSWADVARSAVDAWTGVGRDAIANSGPGLLQRALDGADPLRGLLDDLAGLHEIVE